MAVTQIKVWLMSLDVLNDSDVWGAGEWHVHASVDGHDVGDHTHEHVARRGGVFPFLKLIGQEL